MVAGANSNADGPAAVFLPSDGAQFAARSLLSTGISGAGGAARLKDPGPPQSMLRAVDAEMIKNLEILDGAKAKSSTGWLPRGVSVDLVGTLIRVFLHNRDSELLLCLIEIDDPVPTA